MNPLLTMHTSAICIYTPVVCETLLIEGVGWPMPTSQQLVAVHITLSSSYAPALALLPFELQPTPAKNCTFQPLLRTALQLFLFLSLTRPPALKTDLSFQQSALSLSPS